MTDSENIPDKAPQLISVELRALGVIMEKQLTTPDQYPLTLNSVITACNQKSSRDPVSNYTQGEVARALQELQNRGFVNKEYGSRADKFSQLFIKHLELGRKHQAVLCVMMLRGAQTVSELSARTQRMVDFTDKDELDHTLDRLCNRQTPYCIRLPPQPGQRGERFTHLFSGTPESAVSASTAEANREQSQNNATTVTSSVTATVTQRQQSDNLEIEALKSELAQTNKELLGVKRQLARLYELTGYDPEAT